MSETERLCAQWRHGHFLSDSLLGKIYANKGNLEEAQHWCERAIKRDKLQPEPYYTLSMIYQEHGMLDQATDALKKTIYLDREFVLAHYNLAQLYRQQGSARLAHKSLQNVKRLLEGKPRHEPVPEGDGIVAGRLLQLAEMELAEWEGVRRENGLEATRTIREGERESGGHIPIIAMTAFATKEYRGKCLEAGMDGYVTKPLSRDELNRAIEPFLRKADLGGSGKPPRSRPPVDLGAALEVVGDDVELLQAVVEMSLEECPEQVEALREALARQDAPGVESTAHRLKGILGNLGGLAARDVAQRLETMGEESALNGGSAALAELEAEMGRVVAFYAKPGWEQKADGS